MKRFDDHDAGDLQPIADQLRTGRPELSALELDAIKRRVMMRAATPERMRTTTKGNFMKSRLAILGMLVMGMLLSTTGAGLAVSGLAASTDKNAAATQYTTGGGGVLPDEDTNTPGGNTPGDNGGVAGAGDDNGLQPSRQVEAGAQSPSNSSQQLPFTGFAAIPVLLGGVALLITGLVLRRRTAEDA